MTTDPCPQTRRALIFVTAVAGNVCPELYPVSERVTVVPQQLHTTCSAVPLPSRIPVLDARGFTSLGPAYSMELLCPQHQRGILVTHGLWFSPVPRSWPSLCRSVLPGESKTGSLCGLTGSETDLGCQIMFCYAGGRERCSEFLEARKIWARIWGVQPLGS